MKNTRRVQATQDFTLAATSCLHLLNQGVPCYLDLMENKDHQHPLLINNPLLDDWKNWTMSYGVPRSSFDFYQNFFNQVQENLSRNYYAAFVEQDEKDAYFNNGVILSSVFGRPSGGSFCIPMKNSDIEEQYPERKRFSGTWITSWKPIKGIEYRIPVDCQVFGVVTTDKDYFNASVWYNTFAEFTQSFFDYKFENPCIE